jgi:hypothetical protein
MALMAIMRLLIFHISSVALAELQLFQKVEQENQCRRWADLCPQWVDQGSLEK